MNIQVIQLSLKGAVTLASTVIHRSGTNMDKTIRGQNQKQWVEFIRK